ncbi:hypothetical protein DPMN_052556 [Dreissena polymorpha]|uniref:G-protein coupled receptors family 2 profile 1 domain-containing protein n=1 Tax=Dreissena polymorpha TaxID=45954 RepID=A0A9D4HN44_DREPO|nr:hypothetical protein DPMN_052556 [Dreissena polymorpha]
MSGMYTLRRIAVKKLANNGEIALAAGLRCSLLSQNPNGSFYRDEDSIKCTASVLKSNGYSSYTLNVSVADNNTTLYDTFTVTILGLPIICEAQKDDYGLWPETIVASIAQVPCTSAVEKGTYYRTCLKSGWDQVNNNCSIDQYVIVDVINKISNLNSTRQEDISDTLLNITKTMNTLSNNSKISEEVSYLQDIANASAKLVDYIEQNSDKITDAITDNILGTISNFLDENKHDAWHKINAETETASVEEPVGVATVLSSADRFLAILRNSKCNAFDMNSTEQKDNKNMYVELGLRRNASVQFPSKKSYGSNVKIPQQSITGLLEACFIGAIYPTIGAVLNGQVTFLQKCTQESFCLCCCDFFSRTYTLLHG